MIIEYEDNEKKVVVNRVYPKCKKCPKKKICIYIEMNMQNYCDHGVKNKI